ncbi:MAG: M1 family peptidase, partial [Gemmatimonadota bacterium]|nr:M1 family peptidase [Gemmatimonadota bacterium]
YRIQGSTLSYHWVNVVPGFAMPVKVSLTDGATEFIYPTSEWKSATLHLASPSSFHVDENFYVSSRNADQTVVSR